MKHYDEWISQRDLHEQYESGWLAELAYREALKWVLKDVKETYDDDLSECEFVKHIEDELNED